MDDVTIRIISSRIKLKRLELGYSQEYVAKVLGISQSVYSENERNIRDIPLVRIFQIAAVLNISVSKLLKG